MSASCYTPLTCPQCGAHLPSFEETVICSYCSAHLIRNRAPAAPGSKEVDGPLVQGLRLKTFVCTDSQGTGMEAFRMLIPAGWQTQGGVYWQNTNPGSPAAIHFRMFDPNGLHAFTILPHQPFYWSNDPFTRMTFPLGSQYFGNEVRPPLAAQQALREIIVPRFRNVPGLQVAGEEHLPDLPSKLRAIRPGGGNGASGADGAKICIRYPENGQAAEEEIYAVTEYSKQQMPAMFGVFETVLWVIDYLIAFRTGAGQLAENRIFFQTLLHSFRLEPNWYARVMQISQYLIQNQMQQINNIGQLSRYISQTQNQVSDMIMDSYHQRQQVMDHLADRFSQAIRGVEAYYDPNQGANVELPSGYGHAWSNALGEYVVSDDPNFNPNLGSTNNWTPIQRND